MEITVVIAFDENYAMPGGITLYSLLKNLPEDVHAHIYIFEDNISAASKERLLQLKQHHGKCTIEFVSVVQLLEQLHVPPDSYFSRSMYGRLLIEKLLPNVSKAIYLDSDLLVVGDISKLFATELNNHPLGAVRELYAPYGDDFKQYVTNNLNVTNPADYFNSGVLLMDLEQMRALDLSNQIMDIVRHHQLRFPDQDALNMLYASNTEPLSTAWNMMEGHIHLLESRILSASDSDYVKRGVNNPQIIHYSGRCKPWQPKCYMKYWELYRKYWRESPWSYAEKKHAIYIPTYLKYHKRRFDRFRRRLIRLNLSKKQVYFSIGPWVLVNKSRGIRE